MSLRGRRSIDFTDQRFGELTVLHPAEKSPHGHNQWLVRCSCGNETVVSSSNLRRTKSCGCLARNKFVDLTGQEFGKLIVVRRADNTKDGQAQWVVRCSCDGKEKIVPAQSLRSGNTRSCGCMKNKWTRRPRKGIDLTGQKFGKLTVVRRADNNKHGSTQWVVKCACGKKKVVTGANLRSGHTKTCGCVKKKRPRLLCHRGHPLVDENVHWKPDGSRVCRTCRNMRARAAQKAERKRNPLGVRNREFRRKYGISLAEKEERLARQGGRCEACRTAAPKGRYGNWCMDHNHKTGALRGVLCSPCNTVLGMCEEDPERLSGLIKYLEKYNAAPPVPKTEHEHLEQVEENHAGVISDDAEDVEAVAA